jgi:hypothetical protein
MISIKYIEKIIDNFMDEYFETNMILFNFFTKIIFNIFNYIYDEFIQNNN